VWVLATRAAGFGHCIASILTVVDLWELAAGCGTSATMVEMGMLDTGGCTARICCGVGSVDALSIGIGGVSLGSGWHLR